MNRHSRRALKRNLRTGTLAHPVPTNGVTLSGGPMDGWLVPPDAPVLRAGWLPPPGSPYSGAYGALGPGRVATWEPSR